jgi:hypothetical protein
VQDNERIPRKRRKVTFFRVVLVLLLVAGCAFGVFRLRLRSKLDARIETIRAAGYPVTCEELDKWYSIPEGAENAALTITDAFSHYFRPQDITLVPIAGQAELPSRTEPLAAETRAAIAQYIADNKKALELLHAGAAIDNCRYPVDLSLGAEAMLPDLSSFKDSTKLLSVEAILHEDGDPRLAARSIASAFGLARSLENEPVLVSQLVRVACQGLALSTLERLMSRTDFTDEQLGDLSEAVVEAQAPSAWSRAFVGERCMVLAMLRQPPAQVADAFSILNGRPPKSNIDGHLRHFALALHRYSGLTDRSTIIFLDLMEDYIEATRIPPDGRREAIDTIAARCKAASESDLLLGHIMAPLWRIDQINLRRISRLRAAQVALTIQGYRLAAGELPDTLADLVPAWLDAVPKDPFDGNDLRYKKLERGFVVYSIGQDLSDDGGKEKGPRKAGGQKAPNWDMTFIVER